MVPKFIHFHQVILSTEVGVFGLSRFFMFLSDLEVCAFIFQELNKTHRPFFIFPDNFGHSIRICKHIPSGSQGSGATMPLKCSQNKALKAQVLKPLFYSRCNLTVKMHMSSNISEWAFGVKMGRMMEVGH